MIAKHNVKVNGQWYYAGQEVPETPRQAAKPAVKPAEAPKTEVPGEAKAETRTRSSGRSRANR